MKDTFARYSGKWNAGSSIPRNKETEILQVDSVAELGVLLLGVNMRIIMLKKHKMFSLLQKHMQIIKLIRMKLQKPLIIV